MIHGPMIHGPMIHGRMIHGRMIHGSPTRCDYRANLCSQKVAAPSVPRVACSGSTPA
jgi:hypothetical protein